jgi:ABC-type transporter Mla maintaining outer membrane lipid asymmetry ATPase subunit MlaF
MPTTASPPLLRLTDIRRRFHLGETVVDALNGVSLDIQAGEFLAVWGPSGSGKSTLMNMIGLIDQPTSGTVQFDSADIGTLSDDALTDFRGRRIGFVFQSFNLVPVLSALENVALPLQIQGVEKTAALARARAGLEEVGLADFDADGDLDVVRSLVGDVARRDRHGDGVGIGEDPIVTPGAAGEQQHLGILGDRCAVQFDVLHRPAGLHR